MVRAIRSLLIVMFILQACLSLFNVGYWGQHLAAQSHCSQAKIAEILADATPAKPSVAVNCHAVLDHHRISKKLIFEGVEASGITFNCNGSIIRPSQKRGPADAIVIRSKKNVDGSWARPKNVVIKNCRVFGSIRVYGMGMNGEAIDVRASSRSLGHTQRAQLAAPKHIVFDNVKIVADGRIPLYLAPGVTESHFVHSEISGTGLSVAIYLDAESANNHIQDNDIHLTTTRREQIAVDGSASNKIIGNRFSHLRNGGIYIYRNCGEGGTIRHQQPRFNHLINNIFNYDTYKRRKKAIFVGSRNTLFRRLLRFFKIGFCHLDAGYRFGSSKSNRDFARENVVIDNQIVNRRVKNAIRNKDRRNVYQLNRRVKQAIIHESGCYLVTGNTKTFLKHGDTLMLYRCDDGLLGDR